MGLVEVERKDGEEENQIINLVVHVSSILLVLTCHFKNAQFQTAHHLPQLSNHEMLNRERHSPRERLKHQARQ